MAQVGTQQQTSRTTVPAMSDERAAKTLPSRRSFLIPMVAVVVVVLIVGGGAGFVAIRSTNEATAFAKEAPAQIVAAANTAARQEGSVTVDQSVTESTGAHHTQDQESTLTTGSQHFRTGTASFQNICVPAECYVEGNTAGLEKGFEMPGSLASADAGQWLSLAAGSSTPTAEGQYNALLLDTTLTSLLSNRLFPQHLTSDGTTSINGQRVVVLQGSGTTTRSVHEVGKWYVTTTRPHDLVLSTDMAVQGSKSGQVTIHYIDWGSTKALTAPSSSIPFPITYEKAG
jgi:hypothetical protein